MEFKLSELQQDIANLAKDFAEKKLAPTVKERDEKEVFDRAMLNRRGPNGSAMNILKNISMLVFRNKTWSAQRPVCL